MMYNMISIRKTDVILERLLFNMRYIMSKPLLTKISSDHIYRFLRGCRQPFSMNEQQPTAEATLRLMEQTPMSARQLNRLHAISCSTINLISLHKPALNQTKVDSSARPQSHSNRFIDSDIHLFAKIN